MTVETVKTYAARRRLKVGSEFRDGPRRTVDPVTVEHLVPEAHLWHKAESLLHTGYMSEVEVPIEDLFAALELRQISSADSLEILARLGLRDGVTAHGTHKSPRAAEARTPVTREAAKELEPGRQPGPGQFRNRRKPVKPAKAPAKKSAARPVRTRETAKPTTTSSKRSGTAVMIALRKEVDDSE